MIRRSLAILMVVALAACAANKPAQQSTTSGATDSTIVGTRETPQRQAEVRIAMLDYLLALTRACKVAPGSASDEIVLDDFISARDTCMMDQIRGSLGMIGAPEAACADRIVVTDVLRCALFASAAARVITAAESDPAEMMNWADPEGSLNLATRLLATRSALACGRYAQMTCATREMGTALLLPAAAVDACAAQTTDYRQIQCVATEFLLDHIRTATLYVG